MTDFLFESPQMDNVKSFESIKRVSHCVHACALVYLRMDVWVLY